MTKNILTLEETGYVAERCGRHIHLTAEAMITLFGEKPPPAARELSVLGEYATNCFVRVNEEGLLCRVLLSKTPRKYSQIEVDATTYFKIFRKTCPRLRDSGDVEGAEATLARFNDCRGTALSEKIIAVPVIVPLPHLHIPASVPAEDCLIQFPSGAIVPIKVKRNETRGGLGYIHLDAALYDSVMVPRK